MKRSIAIKFLAFLLCGLSAVAILGCSFGILFMENWNLYNMPLEELKKQQLDSMSANIAWNHAQIHAVQSLSNCPQEIMDDILTPVGHIPGNYAVEIFLGGQMVYSINDPEDLLSARVSEHTVAPNYPIVTHQYILTGRGSAAPQAPTELPVPETSYPVIEFDVQESGIEATAAPAETAPVDEIPAPTEVSAVPDPASALWAADRDSALELVEGQEIVFSTEHIETFRSEQGEPYQVAYILDYYTGPQYRVVVHLEERAALGTEYALMSVMYPYRSNFIPVLLGSLLVFAISLVYLLAAAGHAGNGEIRPAGLNRLPLDLYGAVCTGGVLLLLVLLVGLLDNFGSGLYGIWDNIPLCMLILGTGSFGIALLVIGFLFAFAAQAKVKNGYWWRHSVCGKVLLKAGDFLRWVRRGLQYFYRGCRAVVRLLPIIWQWLLTALVMLCAMGLFFTLAEATYGYSQLFWIFLFIFSVIASFAVVCYGAWCFGALLKGIRYMAQGNLNHQIDTRYLFGCFKEFALYLNSLADAAQQAALRQMKSERMKTELITNVSHDIKTPLTSIINYVDLMKKPHSEADQAAYLEVLDRQSLRLKKLVDDLMDMSKASSGNMSVELGQVDAAEAINQALGEFADKLEKVNLTPVFRHPDTPVIMQADGRLLWRVLSNLLSNAVKYALPDTRLYVDLMVLQGSAVLAIKNISREQLNINAEELMERFVRGDASRNTEGSGLGLNIAKSLVELQKGQMHLMVDGDLFKVTLIFPLV